MDPVTWLWLGPVAFVATCGLVYAKLNTVEKKIDALPAQFAILDKRISEHEVKDAEVAGIVKEHEHRIARIEVKRP